MTKVSVIIPIYNGARYLRESLDSVIQQSLDDIEIICVDDASTDLTPVILKEYSKTFSKMKIITNTENCGAGISRNRGLNYAEGKYVIFLDADDIFEKDMLVQAFHRIEKYDADICVFNEDRFTYNIVNRMKYDYPRMYWNKLEKMGVFSPESIKDIIFNIWNGWPWDKLFKRSFVLDNKLHFQEIKSSEDGLFVHGALSVAEKITCIDKIYVHHREGVTTSLSNQRDDSWECCCSYLKALKSYLDDHGNFIKYKKSFINWAADFLYWNYWSLNGKNREKLFYLLKDNVLKDLEILGYARTEFYNDFYYWFAHGIDKCDTYEDCRIPVKGIHRWEEMMCHNMKKIEVLFRFLKAHSYRTAVWHAGERGKIFLEKYDQKGDIIKVYDEDDKKAGKSFAGRYPIEPFHSLTCRNIDFIIVTNRNFFDTIAKKIKEENVDIFVFNLDLYLTSFRAFPITFEACIL